MKNLAVISLILVLSLAAVASITLVAGSVQTHTVGGSTVETCDKAAVTTALFDFQSNTIQYTVKLGTMSGSTFTPCQKALPVIVTIDLTTGNWQSTDGQFSGTVSAGVLTSANNVTKNLRNGLESLTIGQAIVGGSQVSW